MYPATSSNSSIVFIVCLTTQLDALEAAYPGVVAEQLDAEYQVQVRNQPTGRIQIVIVTESLIVFGYFG